VPCVRRLMFKREHGVPCVRRPIVRRARPVPCVRRLVFQREHGVPCVRRSTVRRARPVPCVRRLMFQREHGVSCVRRPIVRRARHVPCVRDHDVPREQSAPCLRQSIVSGERLARYVRRHPQRERVRLTRSVTALSWRERGSLWKRGTCVEGSSAVSVSGVTDSTVGDGYDVMCRGREGGVTCTGRGEAGRMTMAAFRDRIPTLWRATHKLDTSNRGPAVSWRKSSIPGPDSESSS
jgi:hypothetical protein